MTYKLSVRVVPGGYRDLEQKVGGYWTLGYTDETWECYWCGTRWTTTFADEVLRDLHPDEASMHRALHKLNPQWKFPSSSSTTWRAYYGTTK